MRWEPGIAETGRDGTSLAVTKQHLDELKLQVFGIELVKLLRSIGRARSESGLSLYYL